MPLDPLGQNMEKSDEGVVVEPSISIESVAWCLSLLSLVSKSVSELAMESFPGKLALQYP
jgi:hypothetical protein